MSGIYCADIYCDDCVDKIKCDIAVRIFQDRNSGGIADSIEYDQDTDYDDVVSQLDSLDERDYDSGEYPKGCFGSDESDCPQHCGHCSVFLENDLTSDGEEYVKEAVQDAIDSGYTDCVAMTIWREFYDYIDFGPGGQCINCGDHVDSLDENDECDDCAGDDYDDVGGF
jgi:hypothetical protein